MKRIMIFTLVLVLISSSMVGCSFSNFQGKNSKVKEIKIGITVYDQYDTFIASIMERLEEVAKVKEQETGIKISIEIMDAASSQMEQNNQVEQFVNNEYDIICVNLVDRTDPSIIIDKAKKADIPIIFFNRELVENDLNQWSKLYYVGAVALESGIMEGQLIVDACNDNFSNIDKNGDGILQYVILEGEAGHQDAIIRTEYSVNTIVENGYQVEELAYAIANWNRTQAQTKMNLWIDEFGSEIEVVISNNDDMALGAIDALNKSTVEMEWPTIVGIDGTDVGMRAVEKGQMLGTVYNDRIGQADGILELAYSLVMATELSEEVPIDGKYIRYPHLLINSITIDEKLNMDY